MGSTSEITNKTPNGTNEEESQAFAFASQLVCASFLPFVLKATIELNILEIMAAFGPNAYISPTDIVSKLPTNNPNAPVMVDRMLRLLTCHSVINCNVEKSANDKDVQRLYGLAPVCKYLIKNDDGVSMAPLCLMAQDKVSMESWYHLKDTVLDGGIPFNKAHGMSAFEYPGTDLRFNKVFNKAMSDHTTIAMKKVLETYKGFEGIGSIVDIGGGIGACLNAVLAEYPNIKGINFDLPHVIKDAPFCKGVEHVGGDMFVSVPKANAVFLKWICHDWSDEHCLKLLKNCYDAIPSNGKVILAECILPTSPDTSMKTKVTVQYDIAMLGFNPGGKERNEMEFKALAKSAGFGGFKFFPIDIINVIELTKKI